MSTLLKTIQAMATAMAGGWMADAKDHHYVATATKSNVHIALVIIPELNYRNRARLRFRRLRSRLEAAGLTIASGEEGGIVVSGTVTEQPAAPAPAKAKKTVEAAPAPAPAKAKKAKAAPAPAPAAPAPKTKKVAKAAPQPVAAATKSKKSKAA